MIKTAQALKKFFSSFGIPAYEENSVPDSVDTPYITYQLVEADWSESASVSATVWYKGTSLSDLLNEVDKIKSYVGEGLHIPVEGGCVCIYKGSPFAQTQETNDDKIKATYLLFEVRSLCD